MNFTAGLKLYGLDFSSICNLSTLAVIANLLFILSLSKLRRPRSLLEILQEPSAIPCCQGLGSYTNKPSSLLGGRAFNSASKAACILKGVTRTHPDSPQRHKDVKPQFLQIQELLRSILYNIMRDLRSAQLFYCMRWQKNSGLVLLLHTSATILNASMGSKLQVWTGSTNTGLPL